MGFLPPEPIASMPRPLGLIELDTEPSPRVIDGAESAARAAPRLP